MSMLHIFKEGSVALVDEKQTISVSENGEQPVKIVDPTPENMKKYFTPDNKKSKLTIKT